MAGEKTRRQTSKESSIRDWPLIPSAEANLIESEGGGGGGFGKLKFIEKVLQSSCRPVNCDTI